MKRSYYYICGGKVTLKQKGVWWCAVCNQNYYENPKPTVEAALFNEAGEVLLCERGANPAKGKFDLPGGFMDLYETVEEALTRELKEELGLYPTQFTRLQYLLSCATKYPWGKETYDLASLVFVARLKNGAKLKAQDDVASIKWVKPGKINAKELSHSKLLKIIKQAEALNART